jgi:hypothetical protein
MFQYWDVMYTLHPSTSSQPSSTDRDIISHITISYRYIMYFFRTFKKSTAPYKVHNMGLWCINNSPYLIVNSLFSFPPHYKGKEVEWGRSLLLVKHIYLSVNSKTDFLFKHKYREGGAVFE